MAFFLSLFDAKSRPIRTFVPNYFSDLKLNCMKTISRFLSFPLLVISMFMIASSCQKEAGNNDTIPPDQTRYSVYLTDDPVDFEHVFVDIQKVEVKLDTCRRNSDDDHDRPGCDDDHDSSDVNCNVWQTLDINAGVYDLLQLRNGVDTLLANGLALHGKIERIKITLGTNNSVVVDSTTYPLQLVNNQDFVYINIRREHLDSVSSNDLQFFLDFSLSHSIRFFNGSYWLKPVIKPFGRHSTGEIEGKVRPVHSHGWIKAYNATDTFYAKSWNEGKFKIRGLRPGNYSVFIDGINGYQDTVISNVEVRRHDDTDIGTIQLHQ